MKKYIIMFFTIGIVFYSEICVSAVSTTCSTPIDNKSGTSSEIINHSKDDLLNLTNMNSKESLQNSVVVEIPIYRLYNPNSGEHFHTKNSYEKENLINLGWVYEGISMTVTNEGKDLYRIYNPNSGEHHFTQNYNEITMLERVGWRYEGVAWLTPNKGLPVYRLFNPNSRGAGSHHYTVNLFERNNLIQKGWNNEGIAWYVLGGNSRKEMLIDWFYDKQGRVTYSMSNRYGPNSYDCSSAVFYALIEAGYLKPGTWIGNTETLFSYEEILFNEISRDNVQRGDIFISGQKGSSQGAAGHTGIATSSNTIIHCNYTDNGISETPIQGRTGEPCHWYRLRN